MTLQTNQLTDRERARARAHEYGELDPLRSVDDRLEGLCEEVRQLQAKVTLHELLLDLVLEAVADRMVAAL